MVQVSVGKEKEAISDMLPYLRLGYVSDPSEMQSVISSQGPICPVSLSHYSTFTLSCMLSFNMLNFNVLHLMRTNISIWDLN